MSNAPISFSLEIFPPKNAVDSLSLWRVINIYEKLSPSFISVTCHGMGTTSGLTRELVDAMHSKASVPIAPHMVCNTQSKDEITAIADSYQSMGISQLVALRGDMQDSPQSTDFHYASDLVGFLKDKYSFKLHVAGYPEVHPEAASAAQDMDNLKRKVEAGADDIITQFFFDPDVFLRYRDRVTKAGIDCPIIPGILPILRFDRLVNFAKRCEANVPEFLHTMFAENPQDAVSQQLLAMNVLTHQVTRLIEHGVTHFHFYTLNELLLTSQTCRWLKSAF